MSDKRKPSDKDDTFVFGDEDPQPAHKKPEPKPAAERSFTARTNDPNRFGSDRTRVQSGTTEDGTAVRARNVLNEAFDARTVVRPMAALPPEPKIDLSNPKIPLPPPEREEPKQARRASAAQPERTPQKTPERPPERPREERSQRQSRSAETQQPPPGWSENSIPPMPEPPKSSSRRSSREREEVREHTFPPEMTPAPIPHAPPPAGVQMAQDYYEEEEVRPRRSPLDLLQQKPVAIGIGIAIFTIAAAFFFSSEEPTPHQTQSDSYASEQAPPIDVPPEPQQHRSEPARPQSGGGGGMPSIGTVDSLLNQFDQSYSKTQGQIGGN